MSTPLDMRWPWLIAALVVGWAGAATLAHGQTRQDEVRAALALIEQQAERQRDGMAALDEQARARQTDLNRTRAELIVAARVARGYEQSILALEEEISVIDVRVERKSDDLASRSEALQGTILALQRLALRPQWAMLARPGDPNETVRGGLIMRAAVPLIQERADVLRADLAELSRLRADAAERRAELAAASGRLVQERARLVELAQQKAEMVERTRLARDGASVRIGRLVEEAQDLTDLLQRLDGERRAQVAAEARTRAEAQAVARERENRLAAARPQARPTLTLRATVPITEARGTLIPPTSGQILVHYGESNSFGATAKGITYATRPGAQVVAPYDGRVVFAGPFREFGLILIIEHGEGYHSLLAGLAEIDATVGQWALTGEPVGTTGLNDGQRELSAGANGPVGLDQERSPTLYVELRRKGQPINPLPWLAASRQKVRG